MLEKPIPVLEDARDAIVRVTLGSICTSDLHIKHGSVPVSYTHLDIEKVEGHLYVAIYNSEETFMKKPLTAFRIDVKDTSLSIPCLEHHY